MKNVSVRACISYGIKALRTSVASALKGMGIFGQIEGHFDSGDDPAGLTCMMVNTNVPPGGGTEMGRFFLLSLFVYVKLARFRLFIFNGQHKHGGTPIILGPGIKAQKHWLRNVAVLYSPYAMLSGHGRYSIGFASMFGNLFKLSMEATSLL